MSARIGLVGSEQLRTVQLQVAHDGDVFAHLEFSGEVVAQLEENAPGGAYVSGEFKLVHTPAQI